MGLQSLSVSCFLLTKLVDLMLQCVDSSSLLDYLCSPGLSPLLLLLGALPFVPSLAEVFGIVAEGAPILLREQLRHPLLPKLLFLVLAGCWRLRCLGAVQLVHLGFRY